MQAQQKSFASRHVAETSADARRLSLGKFGLQSIGAILGQGYAPVCYYTINKYRRGCCRRNHGHLQPAGGIGGHLIAQIVRGGLVGIDQSTPVYAATISFKLMETSATQEGDRRILPPSAEYRNQRHLHDLHRWYSFACEPMTCRCGYPEGTLDIAI